MNVGGDELRIALDGGIIVRDRALPFLVHGVDATATKIDDRAGAVATFDRLAEDGADAVDLVLAEMLHPVAEPELERLLEILDGMAAVAFRVVRQRPIDVSDRERGGEVDRLAEICERAISIVLFQIDVAAVAVGPGQARIELDRLALVRECAAGYPSAASTPGRARCRPRRNQA